ncbi:MAG: hypothetical protein ACK50J_17165, partial [Planctomyces sp.]
TQSRVVNADTRMNYLLGRTGPRVASNPGYPDIAVHDDQPRKALIFCRLAPAKRRPRILRVLRDLRVEKQIAQKNTEITKEKLFGRAKLLLSRYCRSR